MDIYVVLSLSRSGVFEGATRSQGVTALSPKCVRSEDTRPICTLMKEEAHDIASCLEAAHTRMHAHTYVLKHATQTGGKAFILTSAGVFVPLLQRWQAANELPTGRESGSLLTAAWKTFTHLPYITIADTDLVVQYI